MANMAIIGGIVVVIVVVVVAAAFLSQHSGAGIGSGSNPSAGGTGSYGSGSGSSGGSSATGSGAGAGAGSSGGSGGSPSTTAPTSGTFQGYQSAPCGPGNSCISQGEAVSMMGAGGSYHSGYAPYSTLAQASAVSGQNYSDYVYTNNVSAFYLVRYNFTTNTSNYTAVLNSKDLIETVIVSPHPQAIYRYNLNASFGGYTVTNATMNGLTYSYLGGSQYGINSTSMIGWKNGEVVYVIATGSYIPQQTLATVVSGDMP